MKQPAKSRQSLEYYVNGILHSDRVVLAQAITLIESTLTADQELASQLLKNVLNRTGNSIRIGITGAPGVGKSTFIEAFGKYLTGLGKKVAVLSIDPSSTRTRGSILGDKTRMADLSVHPNAFIRPSSSGSALGGVAHKTREAILLCEAAGYDIILVETVGVGQSEVAVKNMTDFFLLLMLPGSGDELQGIKKGIMEMADVVVITKADGDTVAKAKQAQADFSHAIHTLHQNHTGWIPKVLTVSSLTGDGMEGVDKSITEWLSLHNSNGAFAATRAEQNIAYLHESFQQLLMAEVQRSHQLKDEFSRVEQLVRKSKLVPSDAARELITLFKRIIREEYPESKK